MIPILLALAGLALTAPVSARAAASVATPATSKPTVAKKTDAAKKSGAVRKTDSPKKAGAGKKAAAAGKAVEASTVAAPEKSEAAARVSAWIAATGDNAALPYIIIDKNSAALFLFDAKGKPLGHAPVLIGIAPGDEATPGIGSKDLAKIGPAEKTTPAGRFLAKFGLAAGRQSVLWVDYATSVAIHPIPPGNPKERRRQRMLSATSDDNRITFGCINVPVKFYGTRIRPLLQKKGGYVYVLPDTKPLEDVFPRLRAHPYLPYLGNVAS